MAKLALFDIDDTLVRGASLHKRAFSYAIEKVYGISNVKEIEFRSGTTDEEIILDFLFFNNLSLGNNKKRLKEEMESYYQNVTDSVKELGGVRNLLLSLKKNNVMLGLATGNFEKIARRKLSFVGLDIFFEFGGFGGPNRAAVINMAINNAKKYGTIDKVIHFGDTISDVRSALADNVYVVGVATGKTSLETLKRNNPTIAVDNLEDTEKLVNLVIK